MDAFRLFFFQYAFAHIAGGLTLFVFPSVFGFIVLGEVSPAVGTLVAFLSIMVGCGWGAVAFLEGTRARRIAVGFALASNTVNVAGHILNAATGRAPAHLGWMASLGCGLFFVALFYLWARPVPAKRGTA